MIKVDKSLAMLLGLAICTTIFLFAYDAKDAHAAAALGYIAGLWGQVIIRVGAEGEGLK